MHRKIFCNSDDCKFHKNGECQKDTIYMRVFDFEHVHEETICTSYKRKLKK